MLGGRITSRVSYKLRKAMLPRNIPLPIRRKLSCCVVLSCADINVVGSFTSSFVLIGGGDDEDASSLEGGAACGDDSHDCDDNCFGFCSCCCCCGRNLFAADGNDRAGVVD